MEKVIDIEDRIPSMREKRRKRTNRKFILVLLIFVVALLILLYFQSEISKIGTIHLKGNELHDQSYYLHESGLAEGDSLWGFSAPNAEIRLEDTKEVKEASVSRQWVRSVEVTIDEWKPIAWLEDKEQYSLVLENGEVFLPDDQSSADLPIAIGFSKSNDRKLLASQLLEMDNSVYQLISEIKNSNSKETDRITLYMDDGYEVHASLSTLADKMAYYPDIVNELSGSEKGVIDIEVGTYFTPYSKIYGNKKAGEENEKKDESKNN